MMLRLGLAFGCLSMLLAGCEEDPPNIPPPVGDADPNAPDASPSDARLVIDAPVDPEGPSGVMILSPTGTPEVPNILMTERLDVRCHAEPNTVSQLPITSVVITITDRVGEEVTAIAGPEGNHDYAANDIFVGGLLNGMLTIRCTATDSDEKMNSDDENPYLDLGPIVNILNPAEGSFQSGQIAISFTAVRSPTLSPDPDADVESVTVILGGQDVTDLVTRTDDTWNGTVSTTDPVLFPTGIVGPVQLTVRATNGRGATRVETVIFTVDDTQPVITIITPEAGSLVGGIITVEAEVEDPAGVNPTSVRATFSNGADATGTPIATFDLNPIGGNLYRGTYDSREIRATVEELFPGVMLVFPTLTVTAADTVGNEGQVGQINAMDYMPPLASLDPPHIREGREDRLNGGIECTAEFDPVGDDAVDDMQTVFQISEYRARIEDRANFALSTSDVVFLRAGINEASVKLVFLDNTTEVAGGNGDALIVDTNGDGKCDDVNPLLMPPVAAPPTAILPVNMVGLTPGGEAYADFNEPWPYANYDQCDPPEEFGIPPARLCPPTGLQRIIEGPFGGPEPVIFVPEEVTDLTCVGFPVDLTTNGFADGWFCVAVVVEDNLGNVGVSQPMRVCLDHDGDGVPACPAPPTYPSDPDEMGYPDVEPTVPTLNPGIDCTGTYTPPATPGMLGTVDSANDCDVPDDEYEFPMFELVREDLDE